MKIKEEHLLLRGAINDGDLSFVNNYEGELNLEYDDYYSPVMVAILMDEVEIFKKLVEKGASLLYLTSNGESPLLYTIKRGNIDLFNYIIEKEKKVLEHKYALYLCLTETIRRNNLEILRIFIKNGINVNEKYQTVPLLSIAISNYNRNDFSIMDELVLNGSDVNGIDYYGTTPLIYATKKGDKCLLNHVLEKYKPNPHIIDSHGNTCFSSFENKSKFQRGDSELYTIMGEYVNYYNRYIVKNNIPRMDLPLKYGEVPLYNPNNGFKKENI